MWTKSLLPAQRRHQSAPRGLCRPSVSPGMWALAIHHGDGAVPRLGAESQSFPKFPKSELTQKASTAGQPTPFPVCAVPAECRKARKPSQFAPMLLFGAAPGPHVSPGRGSKAPPRTLSLGLGDSTGDRPPPPPEIFREGNIAFPTLLVSVRHRVVFLTQLTGGE